MVSGTEMNRETSCVPVSFRGGVNPRVRVEIAPVEGVGQVAVRLQGGPHTVAADLLGRVGTQVVEAVVDHVLEGRVVDRRKYLLLISGIW